VDVIKLLLPKFVTLVQVFTQMALGLFVEDHSGHDRHHRRRQRLHLPTVDARDSSIRTGDNLIKLFTAVSYDFSQ
jgi:hypothetical protein